MIVFEILNAPVMTITFGIAFALTGLYWLQTRSSDAIGTMLVLGLWIWGFAGLWAGILSLDTARISFRLGAWIGGVQYAVFAINRVRRPEFWEAIRRWTRLL